MKKRKNEKKHTMEINKIMKKENNKEEEEEEEEEEGT